MDAIRRTLRLFLLLTVVAALAATITGRAEAQNNDRGTAGMNQGRNCTAQGGKATVYIEEQGDGTSVSYVWCEFADGSGWTCSNTDYGTECSTWLVGPKGSRGGRVTSDLVSSGLTAEPSRRVTPRVTSVSTDAVSEMAPLEEES